jgi:hypothetical protein
MKFKFGGVEFGGQSGALIVTGFDPGTAELRTNDTPRPNRDGVIVGRDFRGGRVWAFDLSTNVDDMPGALATEAALAASWANPSLRSSPNVTAALSYELAGRWRRVYGRPDKFAGSNGDIRADQGAATITCDFRVTDPLYYSDTEDQVKLTIVPASTGGLMAPLKSPLSTVRSSAERAGIVHNQGNASTPLKAVFKGPVTDPWVRSATGMEIGLVGTLAYDQSVTVDPLAGTVIRNGGAPANGMLTRKTRLSQSLLKPGTTELTFGGTDPTGTATATLYWRNAYQSI